MENIANEIIELIKGGSLPASSDFFNDIGLYEVETNTFPHQEGVFWDYKDQFPYSMSDNYFGGILRLVCALHNSFGGIIIFGVHDKKRDPGHNKVRVNIENFNQAIKRRARRSRPFIVNTFFQPIRLEKSTYYSFRSVEWHRLP